jgi:hypothetical protein
MAINLAQIKNQLQPGLMAVEGKYKDIQPEWKDIFKTKQSRLQIERKLQTRRLGMAQVKREGVASFADNNSGDRWVVNMETVEASIMYAMTRKAIADGLYRTEFTPTNLGLNNSMAQFWNTYAANIFNTAGTYDSNTGGDGVALLSVSHPIDTGVYANTSATPQQLNETSLLAAYENIYTGLYDEAGLRIDATAEKIVVPAHLSAVARRLKDAVLRPGTANNEPNVVNKVEAAAESIKVMRYLTSKYAWFLTTDQEGLIHLQRETYETSMWVDELTDTLMVKNYERAGFFVTDPRAVYGQLATS